MAMAALAFTSSGLSSLAVEGAASRVATPRRVFLRIPAAARAPAPLRCIHNHADFVAPLSKVHVPAAADMTEVHVLAASDMMEVPVTAAADMTEVHVPAASDMMELHVPTASDMMKEHGPAASDVTEVHVPAASDMMDVHAPAASDAMEVHVRVASDVMNVHIPAASGTTEAHRPAANDVNVHGPAVAALKDMIAGAFRPLLDNFHQLRSLWTVFNTEDYHIGMPYGALVASVACYQLWKMDPSTFLDAALGYAFYKLSVVSSQVRRKGFSNDIIARIKFGILLIWAVKDFHKALPLEYITYPVWLIYLTTFLYDMGGVKNDARLIYLYWYQQLCRKLGLHNV